MWSTFLRYAFDIVGQSVSALRDNRLRTALSMSGIAIGVTAVMAISTVSKGGRDSIFAELETFGLRSVWVFRDYQDKNPFRNVRKGSGIDTSDVHAIDLDCCPSVARLSPVVNGPGSRSQLIRSGSQFARASLRGVGISYAAINNDHFTLGRNFRQDEELRRRYVAIIGADVHRDLFGENRDPIGRDIRVGSHRFLVVGVLQRKDRGFLASIGAGGRSNENNQILIPYTTYQQMLGTRDVSFIQAEASTLAAADAAAREIITTLARRQHARFEYRSDTMAQYIATAHRILSGVSLIGAIAASISLLVGGLGIMNIMSTAVLERTREIGLRKALGATRFDIKLQFVTEAVFISLVGGMLGLLLGSVVSLVLARITDFPSHIPFVSVLAALAASVGVGLLSGYYPASRAARLRPVEALRYE